VNALGRNIVHSEETLAVSERGVVKCPACEDRMERISRSAFMRALIGSKRYYCWYCHQAYLYFLGYLFPRRR
jgi:transposase-like protein